MTKRYFLGEDGDGHWYLVDASCRAEWDAWIELDEYDETAWDPPDFAERIDHPYDLTFILAPEES